MKRVAIITAVAAALVAVGCSRDQSSGAADEKPVTDETPGAGVVSANELGPQKRRFVPVTTTSNDARVVFERGRELTENIRQAEAAEKFERAIELDPEFALAHAYLAFVTPDRDKANSHFEKAMDLADRLDASERLVIKGMRARKSGNRDEERRLYEELSKLAPKDWRVAMWVGESANRLGDFDGAKQAFERAIELNPEAAEPYNTLGYVYAREAQWDEAVAAAKKYAELKPSEPNPRDSLGEILMMAGRYEEAEQAFTDALEIAPSFWVALEGRALTHCYRAEWDAALEDWRKAREAAPDRTKLDIERQTAFTHLAAGQTRKALARVDAMQALVDEQKIHGGSVQVRFTRAHVYHLARNYRAARRELDAIIDEVGDEDPGAAVAALQRRVWVEVEAGMTARAKKSLAELDRRLDSVERDKFAANTSFARGAVALATGDAKAAVALLEAGPSDYEMEGTLGLATQAQLIEALEGIGKADAARKLRDAASKGYRRDAAWVAERRLRFGSDS